MQSKHDQVLIFLSEIATHRSELSAIEVKDFKQVVIDSLLAGFRQVIWRWHIIGILLDVSLLLTFLLGIGPLTEWINRNSWLLFALDNFGGHFTGFYFLGGIGLWLWLLVGEGDIFGLQFVYI